MANEIDGQFGGRITFNFGGVYFPPSEGEFEIDPALYEVEVKTNQDGTAAYMLKPDQPGADVKFRNASWINWQTVMLMKGNVTITEEDNGRTHLFTGTRFVGKPKINATTGEVSGLKIAGGAYQKIGSS
jgi:hypothetical protein